MTSKEGDMKSKIKDYLSEAMPTDSTGPTQEKKPSRAKPQSSSKNIIHVRGDGNIVAAGNINVHQNEKRIDKTIFSPTDEHISESTARKIKLRIDELVSMEVSGGMERQKAYAKWYAILKKRFDVASYRAISKDLGEEAVLWLMQQTAMKRPSIRRQDNPKWRNQHYKGIWARSRELGLSKADVYHIVHTRIGKKVVSLKNLGERDLKKLYNSIMSM